MYRNYWESAGHDERWTFTNCFNSSPLFQIDEDESLPTPIGEHIEIDVESDDDGEDSDSDDEYEMGSDEMEMYVEWWWMKVTEFGIIFMFEDLIWMWNEAIVVFDFWWWNIQKKLCPTDLWVHLFQVKNQNLKIKKNFHRVSYEKHHCTRFLPEKGKNQKNAIYK